MCVYASVSACICVCFCVYMQPLELIKNVCCNLFYYGGHLWLPQLHPATCNGNLNSTPSTSQAPIPESPTPNMINQKNVAERVLIAFADLFHNLNAFYLPNLNKSKFQFGSKENFIFVYVRQDVDRGSMKWNGVRLGSWLSDAHLSMQKCNYKSKKSNENKLFTWLTKLTHI